MKSIRQIIIWTAVVLFCLLSVAFAGDTAKVMQAVESGVKVIYNSREVTLGAKPYSIGGAHYLPIDELAALFNKNIYWNHNQNKIFIADKPDAALESLKSELAAGKKTIAELQEKVKQLEKGVVVGKRLSITELQDMINNKSGLYEGVSYRVVLSGNEEDVRVKIEIDLSYDKEAWSRLNITGRKEMIREICNPISGEYPIARITGYIKDISNSKRLISFYNTSKGDIEMGIYKNYSTISVLEEAFNDEYDNYFKGIHFTYVLRGNENKVEYTVFIQKSKFEEKWAKLSDNNLKGFMKNLCSETQRKGFKNCHVTGYIYDSDRGVQMAFCEQTPDKNFNFSRWQ